ncbi:MAG: hypothetical protein ACR2FI_03670, partial [Burkholderiales bacterium]
MTAWLVAPEESKQFAPSKASFMVNYAETNATESVKDLIPWSEGSSSGFSTAKLHSTGRRIEQSHGKQTAESKPARREGDE